MKEKEMLTEERVRTLTLGIKRNLFRKISYAVLALTVLAAGIFFSKDSLRYFIDTRNYVREKVVTKDKVAPSVPVLLQKRFKQNLRSLRFLKR
jgi:hypothetical protein